MPSTFNHFPRFIKGSSRLAARARILYLVIPAITIIVILGIGQAISTSIAEDSSRRLARQYSIETSANFLVSINPHFVLMQQLSRSTTISRWLANEDDAANRVMAFEEIMGYAVFLPDAYLMFTVYESLQGYDFSVDLTPEEFLPWGRLAGGEVSRWFYETRDAEVPFILNVQRTRPVDGIFFLYIWSNHRMYYQGRFVGVVTVGSPFETIFDTTFRDFDVNYRRGYIIDRYGAVRADSAMLLDILAEGLATFPAIPEAACNPILLEHINNHMERLVGGVFPPGIDTLEAIPLSVGIYTYASIAPIVGTDWSVVVLSNHLSAFGGALYTPLIVSAIVVFVLSMLVGNILVRRVVITPLFKLKESTATAASPDVKADLFGLERDDEIGDLARTVQIMRDGLSSANVELKENALVIMQAQEDLKHREKLLNTVNMAAEVLLTANEKGTMDALMEGMEIVGRCLDVDCVQIWYDEVIDGESFFVMRYEWQSALGRVIAESPIGLKVPGSIRNRWLEIFRRGENINGPISKLPPEEVDFMKPYKIVSTAMLPLFLDNEFFGFFGIDDCEFERVFTGDEMRMFASAGLMFASVFNRNAQRDLAMTDVLTGVRNRRYLKETAEQELQNCLKKNLDFSLIMIDIDHFKSINDRYGHASGDAVLKILTARLRHVLKHDTLLARYGGEEFVVTLPEVDHETAIKTAWRLQKTVEASPFSVGDSVEINITSSFGVASRTTSCTTLSDIIDKADKALYRAKNGGRNTVVGYNSPA